MPLKVYENTTDGRIEARDTDYWALLHDEPNPEQSTVDCLTQMMWWAVLFGNAYAEIVRDGAGRVTHLYPIPPTVVTAGQNDQGQLVYEIKTANGDIVLPSSEVLTIRGPSPDGTTGYRLVQTARESFGLSLALDRFGSAYFGNNCKVAGVIKATGALSDAARENIRAGWVTTYGGVDNAFKVPVLEVGLDFQPFEVSNEAGQFVQSRQHQIYEICRWVGVDPIFVFEYGRATWNNAEAQTRNFLQFSLNPWLRKLECEISRKVISPADRGRYYAEFVREAIIQMDTKTQHDVWAIGVDKGWYTKDEVRKWLNLPKVKEGA